MSEINGSSLIDDCDQPGTSGSILHLPKDEELPYTPHFHLPSTSLQSPPTSLAGIVNRADEILLNGSSDAPEDDEEEEVINHEDITIDMDPPVVMQTMEMHQGTYGLVTRTRDMTQLEKKEMDMGLLKKEEFALLKILDRIHQKKRLLMLEHEKLKRMRQTQEYQLDEEEPGSSTGDQAGPSQPTHSMNHDDIAFL